MARARRGFTLIEVLGAVILLGLVVTYVSRAAIEGMGYAGDAQERLAASLLADRLVMELEESGAGGLPTLGERQLEEQGFRATVRVDPFDPAAFGLASLLEPEDRRSTPAPDLFVPPRNQPPAVYSVDVRVRWADGVREQEVVRNTILVTPSAVPELANLAASAAPGTPGATGSSSGTGSSSASGGGAGPTGGGTRATPAGSPTQLPFPNPRIPRGGRPQ